MPTEFCAAVGDYRSKWCVLTLRNSAARQHWFGSPQSPTNAATIAITTRTVNWSSYGAPGRGSPRRRLQDGEPHGACDRGPGAKCESDTDQHQCPQDGADKALLREQRHIPVVGRVAGHDLIAARADAKDRRGEEQGRSGKDPRQPAGVARCERGLSDRRDRPVRRRDTRVNQERVDRDAEDERAHGDENPDAPAAREAQGDGAREDGDERST